jgi:hypothetical protein
VSCVRDKHTIFLYTNDSRYLSKEKHNRSFYKILHHPIHSFSCNNHISSCPLINQGDKIIIYSRNSCYLNKVSFSSLPQMIPRNCTKSRNENENSFDNVTKTSPNLYSNIHNKNGCSYQSASKWDLRKSNTNSQKQTPGNYSLVFHFQPKMNDTS